ncbi:MAG TPA: hypothetical protein VFS59_06885, partial [Gemmatimonadaceae bacterium]|nr:hypothetical protein [Gemmatimonadaceae bacterium]
MASRKRATPKRPRKTARAKAGTRPAGVAKTAKAGKTAKVATTPAPAKRASAKSAKRVAAADATLEEKMEAAESAGATTIVYVHGIGNKPPASVLKGQWDHALFEFDLGERSRMAYWVDRERYPVPINDVRLGGDYADGSENAPTGEVSARTIRADWNPREELTRIQESEIAELVGPDAAATADTRDAARLTGIAGK